jgi:hypothetical protein
VPLSGDTRCAWLVRRHIDPETEFIFVSIAVGCSLRFPDDMENLAHQFEVYDALYSYRRLLVARE